MKEGEEVRPIIISAGGTGGHLFPAQALTKTLQHQYPVILFTDKRSQIFQQYFSDVPCYVIPVRNPYGQGVIGRGLGVLFMIKSLIQALVLLLRLQPLAIVGFGAYPSIPSILGARLLRIPIILHEQNSILGRANTFLARFADKIALSFPLDQDFPSVIAGKCTLTGTPIRFPDNIPIPVPYSPPTSSGEIRLLVLGGSQGAQVLSDVVPEALALLEYDVRQRLYVSYQARTEDVERTTRTFFTAGIRGEVSCFFSDVIERLAVCHLLIARSGASTVAEVTALGRPALFVPYPYAIHDHQRKNAEIVVRHQGAELITQQNFTPNTLLHTLNALLQNPQKLQSMAQASRTLGYPDAHHRLATLIQQTITQIGNR